MQNTSRYQKKEGNLRIYGVLLQSTDNIALQLYTLINNTEGG